MISSILITGIGTVSPLGTGVAALLETLRAPARAVASSPSDPCLLPAVGFDPKAFIAPMVLRRLDRASALAIAAARLCVADAGYDMAAHDMGAAAADRTAIVLGTGGAGIVATGALFEVMVKQGAEAASAMTFPNTVPNAPAGQVAIALGAGGPSATFAAKSGAAEDAICFAADLLLSGRADAAIAGGVDDVGDLVLHAYRRFRALSPSGAARPFDRRRDGVTLGEGATVLLLETEERARAREGARIYARLLGHAAGTAPAPPSAYPADAAPLARNLRAALADAGVAAGALMHVSASANGSPGLDRLEAAALASALGPALAGVPVTSLKGAAGDGMAGGALRAAAAALSIAHGLVPGTAGLEEQDAALGPLDVVRAAPRLATAGPVLLSSLGDGGALHSLVLGPA